MSIDNGNIATQPKLGRPPSKLLHDLKLFIINNPDVRKIEVIVAITGATRFIVMKCLFDMGIKQSANPNKDYYKG